jgi:hypothetical protein
VSSCALSDKSVSEHEQETVDMILQRYGYTRGEVEEVVATLKAMNQFRDHAVYGPVLGAATELPLDRKEKPHERPLRHCHGRRPPAQGETDFIETLEGILLSHT